MKANLSKSLIPAVLVIAGLVAGTGLLAGYVDGPSKAPQAAVEARCDGCPRLDTDACCKVTGVCASLQTCTAPCVSTAANPTPPCASAEGCASPCCPMTCQSTPACCAQEKPQTAPCSASGCPIQTISPCGDGGCTPMK